MKTTAAYEPSAPGFPCREFPAEARHARLLGVYPQRQEGRYMQRVRIPAGLLTAPQWRALAAAVRRLTPQTPLHLTTRQDLELHDLAAQDVSLAQQALAEAHLTSLGSGGDTLRNVTVCPCAAGGSADAPNLLPLAEATAQALAGYQRLFGLPRKFKISFSGCPQACGRPFIHDLAFLAVQRDGEWGLQAVGAGSLGPRPELGIPLYDWLPPQNAPALALAAMRLFDRLGDRQNRGKARLRHVRQRLGDDAFRAELETEFQAVLAARSAGQAAEHDWPEITSLEPAPRWAARRALAFINGDVTPADAEALADLAADPTISVRIGNDHRVWVFGEDARYLSAALSAALEQPGRNLHGQTSGGLSAPPAPVIVACPGTRWCARGLADTTALAERIRQALAASPGATAAAVCRRVGTSPLPGTKHGGESRRASGPWHPEPTLIGISGCPNGCALSAVADIGIYGGRSASAGAGDSQECYRLVAGGGAGRTSQLAAPIAAHLDAAGTAAEVARRIMIDH